MKLLENGPSFDQDSWPMMDEPSWQQAIHAFYGTQAYADTQASQLSSTADA